MSDFSVKTEIATIKIPYTITLLISYANSMVTQHFDPHDVNILT